MLKSFSGLVECARECAERLAHFDCVPQGEAHRGFRGQLNLLVAGQSGSGRAGSGARSRTDRRALAAAEDAAQGRAEPGAAGNGYSRSLSFAF
jgi:hypothetical protein